MERGVEKLRNDSSREMMWGDAEQQAVALFAVRDLTGSAETEMENCARTCYCDL